MEISFIDSDTASPILTPNKDAESVGEDSVCLQANKDNRCTIMTDYGPISQEEGSSGEGVLGSSDDGTDPTVHLELSNSHGNRKQLFSFSLY